MSDDEREEQQPEEGAIYGRKIDLDEMRRVAGWRLRENSFGFVFTNDGKETRIVLSREAVHAMVQLVAELSANPQQWALVLPAPEIAIERAQEGEG